MGASERCGHCDKPVGNNDKVCPYCYAPLIDHIAVLKANQRRTRLFVIIGAVSVAVFGVFVVNGLSGPTQSYELQDRRQIAASPQPIKSRNSSTPAIALNDPVLIGHKMGKGVIGAKVYSTREVRKHLIQNPSEESQFQQAGLVFGANAHTKAIVRDVSLSGDVKVELLSGSNVGKVGWVDGDYILPGESW